MISTEKINKITSDIEHLIKLLKNNGIVFTQGLSDKDIMDIEKMFSFSFPTDLKLFLQTALPVSEGFINWRSMKDIKSSFDWVFEGIAFDIRNNGFWYDNWGDKPDSLTEQICIAKSFYKNCPKLLPLYSHRFLPSTPCEMGNPVLSVWQTDIIYYDNDLLTYLCHEFGIKNYKSSFQRKKPKHIEFWSDLIL